MSIKAYKGLVVPFPCHKDWKWMLDPNAPRCNNCERDSKTCIYINCMDCVYNTAVARADYYKHCFPEENLNTWKGLVIPVPPKKEWTWHHNKGCCAAGGKDIAGCAGISCINCIYGSFHIKQFDEFYKYKYGTADSASCSTCKNYEPKDSPDREMLPVYEFDWYTQWKYSQREDKYYYIEDIRKNRARELKTGELVNELPADVIVVSPTDPDPAVLIATAVQHVPTGNYYVIQKVEGDGSRIYVKDMDWEKSEFYKNFIDKWGRPVCYFTKATGD